MSKDGKNKAAQEPREIPIDGADEATEGAAEAAAPAPEAEQVETAEAAEAEADSIEEEAEAVVADAERVAKERRRTRDAGADAHENHNLIVYLKYELQLIERMVERLQ